MYRVRELYFDKVLLASYEEVESIKGSTIPKALFYVPIDNVELMQFTGLTDKNGKEIYEGDILKWHRPYGGGPYDPEIELVGYYDMIKDNDGMFVAFGGFMTTDDPTKAKVIGNIHMNPELLK